MEEIQHQEDKERRRKIMDGVIDRWTRNVDQVLKKLSNHCDEIGFNEIEEYTAVMGILGKIAGRTLASVSHLREEVDYSGPASSLDNFGAASSILAFFVASAKLAGAPSAQQVFDALQSPDRYQEFAREARLARDERYVHTMKAETSLLDPATSKKLEKSFKDIVWCETYAHYPDALTWWGVWDTCLIKVEYYTPDTSLAFLYTPPKGLTPDALQGSLKILPRLEGERLPDNETRSFAVRLKRTWKGPGVRPEVTLQEVMKKFTENYYRRVR